MIFFLLDRSLYVIARSSFGMEYFDREMECAENDSLM